MKPALRLVLTLCSLLVLRALGADPSPSSAAPALLQGPRLHIELGDIEGERLEGGVVEFLGLPYARPPVGELRWQSPRPLKAWAGVRAAKQFGPRSMQAVVWKDMIFRSPEASEDCLYLNVWAPATAKPGDRLPVLVYFHGGGLFAGDGSEPRYDGAAMARGGVVMVTVNYRLGVFGFFAHPELAQERLQEAVDRPGTVGSGNQGYLDQVAALTWVRDNIAYFGGDASHVCIAGESAGSISVSALMASPAARGLFSAGIGQSGSLLGALEPQPYAEAEALGLKLQKAAGVSSLAELRALPAKRILELALALDGNHAHTTLDGRFLVESPRTTYEKGRQARVPLMVGWTSEEMGAGMVLGAETATPAHFREALNRLFGKDAERVAAAYPATNDTETLQSATDLASDLFIAQGTWKWSDLQARTGGVAVYRYHFEQVPPPENAAAWGADFKPGPPKLGAPHSSDIPYALGNLTLVKLWTYGEEHRKTETVMHGYVLNFVKTWNPNGAGLPAWPQLDPDKPSYMALRAQPAALSATDGARRQLLDSLWGVARK